jgi:hypothetical protein
LVTTASPHAQRDSERQQRDCRAAGDGLIAAIGTVVKRVDSGAVGGESVTAMFAQVPVEQLGRDLGRECGQFLIGTEYSRIIVEVNNLSPATLFGRQAKHGSLLGLCDLDGVPIPLSQQARVVCAGG